MLVQYTVNSHCNKLTGNYYIHLLHQNDICSNRALCDMSNLRNLKTVTCYVYEKPEEEYDLYRYIWGKTITTNYFLSL